MKYRLKKDLPFAKAGAKIKPPQDEGCAYDVENINGDWWCIGYEEELPKLISEGWIEEVKPREWYICWDECMISNIVNEKNGVIPNWDNIVKVREVID